MANKTQQIIIDSILGGISDYTQVFGQGEFLGGIGINPNRPVLDDDINPVPFLDRKSGTIAPLGSTNISSALSSRINHFASVPQNISGVSVYAYGAGGSLWSISNSTVTNVPDGGTLSGGSHATGNGASSGNGMAYYDNYLYLAKNTTIARYGPLDGTPVFDGDYWGTTLAKPALENTTNYPNAGLVSLSNHQLYRHSDGRLYIYDISGGQAVLHYIKTKKTTVEGDTDDGSTYGALTLGYNLMPTAMTSYGDEIVVAVLENKPTTSDSASTQKSKLYFWNGTSTRADRQVWSDVPNTYVTAMVNANGALILFTAPRPYGGIPGGGFRISQYIGGTSFSQLFKTNLFTAPQQSAVYAQEDTVVFGSTVFYDNPGTSTRSGVFRVDLNGTVQGVMPISSGGPVNTIACLFPYGASPNDMFYVGTNSNSYICLTSNDCSGSFGSSFFLSQVYNLGRRFKITKIELNLANYLDADQTIIASIWKDSSTEASDITTLTTINSTNFSGKKKIVLRPNGLVCDYNFFLKLEWTGVSASNYQPAIILPILIDYEFTDD